jgi:hypothetical protein
VQGTFTPKLSNMPGTHRKRASRGGGPLTYDVYRFCPVTPISLLVCYLPNGDLPWLFTMALRINMLLPRDNACCMTVLCIYSASIYVPIIP